MKSSYPPSKLPLSQNIYNLIITRGKPLKNFVPFTHSNSPFLLSHSYSLPCLSISSVDGNQKYLLRVNLNRQESCICLLFIAEISEILLMCMCTVQLFGLANLYRFYQNILDILSK